MIRPVIGIVANFYDRTQSKGHAHTRVNEEYTDAIVRAGGLPVILPIVEEPAALEQFLDAVSGVLFVGGYDIDPARYGQPRHRKTEVLARRLEPFQFAMFEHVDCRPDLPVLGICLGCQLFNVARGGTLHQHLPEVNRPNPVDHFATESQYTGGRAMHPVRIQPGTKLAALLSGRGEIQANSGHHQAIDRVGRGLQPSAFAPDGIIEALEDPSRRFLISVQWHPEDLVDRPEHLAIFEGLVGAAKNTSPPRHQEHQGTPRNTKNAGLKKDKKRQ